MTKKTTSPEFISLEEAAKMSLSNKNENRLERIEKALAEAVKTKRKKIKTH